MPSANLILRADGMPQNQFGFFLNSQQQGLAFPSTSQGALCLSGSIGRYVGPGEIQNAGMSGSFSLQLDLAMTPTPNAFVAIAAGETWYFQAWFRDSTGGPPTSNFTDGLQVDFVN